MYCNCTDDVKVNLAKAEEKVERRKKDRRQRKIFFFYPERRTGFDRRKKFSSSKVSVVYEELIYFLKDNSRIFLIILVFLNVLNLADYIFTLGWLSLGLQEMNPIMNLVFDTNPYYAGFFKISMGVLISLIIWRFRNYRMIIELGIAALFLYLMLYLYHLLGAIFLVA